MSGYFGGVGSLTPVNITDEAAESIRDKATGFYAVSTSYYDDATENNTQEIEAGALQEGWVKLLPDSYILNNHLPDSMKDLTNIYNETDKRFSCAGMNAGSHGMVRILTRVNPEVDESILKIRLAFTTNTATSFDFNIEAIGTSMTQGAGIQYSDEVHISYYAGSELNGTTVANAGSFVVEVQSSVDATVETLAINHYVYL